jgi:DNA-binding NarL/FixJ family response regulator
LKDFRAVTHSKPAAPPILVGVVEDDEGIRSTLTVLIARSPSFKLVSSCVDAETALEAVPEARPDVVLMDINLPRMDGVECVRRLKARLPEVQFIMLTVYEDNDRLFASLMAGANGYLLKRTAPEKLLSAIREVFAGGSPMSPQIARRVVQQFRHEPEPAPGLDRLTPRERDVLDQLARGYRYKEIVDNLGISLDTVRSYIRNIYEKLRVHSRTEAVVKYLRTT